MSSQTHPQRTFGSKLSDCFRSMFSCCRGFQDEDEEDLKPRKALVISGPTNFRREEINIPGLTPSQERFVREKAARDASQLYTNLQPLASSPSGIFAERPNIATTNPSNFPTYEQFTQPRSAPSPQQSSRIDRVMAHGRKLSDTFRRGRGRGI